MEIRIQIKGRVFVICLGRKAEWFESIYWIDIFEEWYSHREVVYAKSLMTWFKKWPKGKVAKIKKEVER